MLCPVACNRPLLLLQTKGSGNSALWLRKVTWSLRRPFRTSTQRSMPRHRTLLKHSLRPSGSFLAFPFNTYFCHIFITRSASLPQGKRLHRTTILFMRCKWYGSLFLVESGKGRAFIFLVSFSVWFSFF
jgi:hypothetical protein